MRQQGFLISRKGTDYNMPTQRSMEMGLFEVKERTVNNPDGSVRITKTTVVTGRGQGEVSPTFAFWNLLHCNMKVTYG